MTTTETPREVVDALGPLMSALVAHGFQVERSTGPESFGNFEVVFSRDGLSFSVVHDRGQFHVDGAERSVLEPAGLWRTFSGAQSLVAPLLAWLERTRAV